MNSVNSRTLNDLMDIFDNNSKFYISSHVNPDGDSIGSMLGLGLGLIKKGKDVIFLKNDTMPKDYEFLPKFHLIQELDEPPTKIDVFISLDSSDPDRLGDNKSLLDISDITINIDHHVSNTNFGNLNLIYPDASATGEIVYEILKKMQIDIDMEIAENLYTAISTDTGGFKYSNVSGKTHKIISELMETGIETSQININLYENMSLERTRLFINALKEVNFYFENRVAIASVTQSMLENFHAKWEDTEGIVSFIRKIKDIEVAVLLKEIEVGEIKASLRSKSYVDVSNLCSKLGGGGHIRAAGCTIYSTIEEAEKTIIHNLKDKLR